jgi:4-hydroxy-tetrahydrodipicolinate reductase
MNLLILGRGKTGSMVAEMAHSRRHHVKVLSAADNANAGALTPDSLATTDVVIDFTTPTAAVANAEACIRARKNIVVGTTGWYDHIPRLRETTLAANTGLLHGSNFSIGVNLFFDVVVAAAPALKFNYSGQIFERHHATKKDAPSGTALIMQKVLRESSANIGGTTAGTTAADDNQQSEVEIVSFREGDVVGMHELVFNSPADRIYLCHDAKSRQGFAEGAVRAAEWLAGKSGFFDFRNIWREL